MSIWGFIAPTSIGVEQRFQQSLAWNNQTAGVIITVPTDDYRFYAGSDVHTQVSTQNLMHLLNLARNDTQSQFIILTGDLIDQRGAFQTFTPALKHQPAIQAKNDTVFVLVGNHDLYFDQWSDYLASFRTSSYYFMVQTPTSQDLFIVLDSGSGTLGKSQRRWLEKILKTHRNNMRHCIISSHTNMFCTDYSEFPTSSMPLEETYDLANLFSQYRVSLYLNGHDHVHDVEHFRGVQYITIGTMRDDSKNPVYLTVDVGTQIHLKSNQFNQIY